MRLHIKFAHLVDQHNQDGQNDNQPSRLADGTAGMNIVRGISHVNKS